MTPLPMPLTKPLRPSRWAPSIGLVTMLVTDRMPSPTLRPKLTNPSPTFCARRERSSFCLLLMYSLSKVSCPTRLDVSPRRSFAAVNAKPMVVLPSSRGILGTLSSDEWPRMGSRQPSTFWLYLSAKVVMNVLTLPRTLARFSSSRHMGAPLSSSVPLKEIICMASLMTSGRKSTRRSARETHVKRVNLGTYSCSSVRTPGRGGGV
mmetsp:Transcript_22458/g.64195  ORF Transcript_22458/g.64195 Transcript_22458/m.64195 type:complete len:206 (+) Transcript_22458:1047-1664(+)